MNINKISWRTIGFGILVSGSLLAIIDPLELYPPQMVGYEILNGGKVLLGFDDGECEVADLDKFSRKIDSLEISKFFVGVPVNGTNSFNEYIDLRYIDHFLKMSCGEQELYLAVLHLKNNAACSFIRNLFLCGSGPITNHTYKKWVSKLTNELNLGPPEQYEPKIDTTGGSFCNCY